MKDNSVWTAKGAGKKRRKRSSPTLAPALSAYVEYGTPRKMIEDIACCNLCCNGREFNLLQIIAALDVLLPNWQETV